MTLSRIPDNFGREWRAAVFERVTTTGATRLAWVLLDLAYSKRRTDPDAGYRLLRELSELHGRNFERARDELVAHELLEVRSGIGRLGRSVWQLRLPARGVCA